MSLRQLSENLEPEVEVKIEPNIHEFRDEDNDLGFPGFDNSAIIPPSTDPGSLNLWTSHATTCLITQYKKYHSMVGQTARLRSFREMFEMISLEMQKFGYYFSPQKCENKWRVLERKYKNLVFRERMKKPGRIRHYGHWEHKRALDEIFNEKKRHVYLEESDFPVPSGSAKFAQKTIRDMTRDSRTDPAVEPITNVVENPQKPRESGNKVSMTMFESFIAEMKKNFALAETNRERRHKEKMEIRRYELEVQKQLLKFMEDKMEFRRNQMIAATHFFDRPK